MRLRRPAATLAFATFLIVWGLITHGTYAGSGDEVHYLMIARSLAFDGDADLVNDYADATNLVGGGTAVPEAHLRPGRGGVLRPVHDIGLPVMAAPLVRVMYPLALWVDRAAPDGWMARAKLNASLLLRHQLSLAMALVAGWVAIEIWRALGKAGLPQREAFWWALLTTASPPILSYSFLFFTELIAALIVLICFRQICEPARSPAGWLLTGVLTAWLTVIHIRNGPISLALAVIAIASHWPRWRQLVPFAAGIAAIAVFRTVVHWHFWGTLFVNDHARIGGMSDATAMLGQSLVRASGMLLDQEFGLLALAPIYLLALPGLLNLWRRAPDIARPLSVVAGVAIGSIVLPMINPYGFVGGWSPAPRFLVPVVPLLAIAVPFGATGTAGPRRALVWALVALQIAIDLVVWNEPKVLWDNADGVSAVTQALPALQRLYTVLPTWHGPAASAWPFVLGVLLMAAVTLWLVRRQSSPVGRSQ